RAGAHRELPQETPHHLFGMTEAVYRSGIDPVDSLLERATHRGERIGVVLGAPAERPAAAADRPRAEADGGDIESARAERTGRQRHTDNPPGLEVKESAALSPWSSVPRAAGAPPPPARAALPGRCAASACRS